jgi:hypothetical protein
MQPELGGVGRGVEGLGVDTRNETRNATHATRHTQRDTRGAAAARCEKDTTRARGGRIMLRVRSN